MRTVSHAHVILKAITRCQEKGMASETNIDPPSDGMAFHSGDMLELEAVNLSGAEKEALLGVMQRAKQFDQQYTPPEALEGQLYKWTNPLKGWQPRWFTVDRQQGMLHYHMSEDRKKQAPRGSLQLWGAAISPSEEDSQSFSISDTSGEVYKLRAGDAKERQFWVSRLHREVELCISQNLGTPVQETLKIQGSASLPPPTSQSGGSHDPISTATGQTTPTHSATRGAFSKRLQSLSMIKQRTSTSVKSASPTPSSEGQQKSHDKSHDLAVDLPGGDAMLEVLMRLQCYQECLVAQLQLNSKQAGFNPADKNVLLLRATSQAAVYSVKDCLALLKLQQQTVTSPDLVLTGPGRTDASPPRSSEHSDLQDKQHTSRTGSFTSRSGT